MKQTDSGKASRQFMDHDQWVARQFDLFRADNPRYRDALLHASFIESIVRNKSESESKNKSKSKELDFFHAIDWLRKHEKIEDDESVDFHKVRDARNRLVHDIFKPVAPGKEFPGEKEINRWVIDLISKIRTAYRESPFLKKELFTKYNVPIPKWVSA